MSLATPSNLGAGDYTWRFSLGRTNVPIANWAAMGVPVGFGAALTKSGEAEEKPKGVFDKGSTGGEGGVGSGVSSQSNQSQQSTPGGWSQPDFTPGKAMWGIGSVLGVLGPPGIGTAISGIGTLSDVVTANQSLEQLGMPGINGWEAFGAQALQGAFGLQTAKQQHDAALAAAWDTDIANAAQNFDNWGPVGGFGFNDPDPMDEYGYGPAALESVDYAATPDGAGAQEDTAPSDNYGTTADGNYGGDFGSSGTDDSESSDDSIICTELMRQGRLSKRLWIIGTKEFQGYWEYGKRGYYLWSIPVVKHLKAHPESRFSAFIERLFNCRARYVAARNGYRYRKTLTGALVTKGMYGLCWSLAVLWHNKPDQADQVVQGHAIQNDGHGTLGVVRLGAFLRRVVGHVVGRTTGQKDQENKGSHGPHATHERMREAIPFLRTGYV